MKKMLMKVSFQQLIVALFLFVGVSIATTSSAQVSIQWKNEQIAEDILMNQIEFHAPSAVVGNPGYDNAYRHVYYFKHIIRLMQSGVSTELAAQQALNIAGAPDGAESGSAPVVPKSAMGALYNEAVDLLTD